MCIPTTKLVSCRSDTYLGCGFVITSNMYVIFKLMVERLLDRAAAALGLFEPSGLHSFGFGLTCIVRISCRPAMQWLLPFQFSFMQIAMSASVSIGKERANARPFDALEFQ